MNQFRLVRFETKISSNVDKEDWNNQLKQSTVSTASQMADCFLPHQLTYNSKPFFITISNSLGEIVGQLSTIIHFTDYGLKTNIISKMLNSKFRFGTILRWSHGPIIYDMDNAEEIISSILKAVDTIALTNHVNVISGTSPPQVENMPIGIFKKNGYEVKNWITYVTDLERDIDDVYHALHNKTRYDIRKGEKSNLEFEVSTSRESMDYYLKIKYPDKKIQEKIKTKYDKFNDNIWKSLVQNGYKKNFVIKINGKPEAVITNFLFNRNVSQVGVSTSNNNKYTGTFLTWNAIKWASENGYRTYDVGGANPNPISSKEKGIELFKSKWASKKINYYICTKIVDKKKYRISRIIKQPSTIKNKLRKISKEV